jgi:hypothetical protein
VAERESGRARKWQSEKVAEQEVADREVAERESGRAREWQSERVAELESGRA